MDALIALTYLLTHNEPQTITLSSGEMVAGVSPANFVAESFSRDAVSRVPTTLLAAQRRKFVPPVPTSGRSPCREMELRQRRGTEERGT